MKSIMLTGIALVALCGCKHDDPAPDQTSNPGGRVETDGHGGVKEFGDPRPASKTPGVTTAPH